MEAVPLLLSLFALAIVSMDLALAIVWTRRVHHDWTWAGIVFLASLLGAVVFFALDQYSFLVFTGTALTILHYIWEGILAADSAFIIALVMFAVNWIIARPMTRAEMVMAVIMICLYISVSVMWIITGRTEFSVFQYLIWTLSVVYCVSVLLRSRRDIADRSVRTVSKVLIIISFAMLPVVVFSMIFSALRNISIPIVCLSYTIAILVFLFAAVARTERPTAAQPKPSFSFESVNERFHITEREFEVIKLIKSGLTNKEIASELSISVNTVNNHIANIFAKTEVRSRIDLLNLLEEASW